jgi:hypothetical protein
MGEMWESTSSRIVNEIFFIIYLIRIDKMSIGRFIFVKLFDMDKKFLITY